MKFFLDKEYIDERHFGWTSQDKHYRIGLSKLSDDDYIELNLHKSFNCDSIRNYELELGFDDLLKCAKKLSGLTVIKENKIHNPYWKFYQVKYDWNKHKRSASRIIRTKYIEELENKLSDVSSKDLKAILERREKFQ